MYLGIILHASVPFLPWRGTYEISAGYGLMIGFIHGFRMPLFMIISGFFSAMIMNRGGINKFIDNRLRKIGLPYIIFLPLVTILFIAAFFIGGIFVDWDSVKWTKEAKENLEKDQNFDNAHLWFMYFLMIFTFVYSSIIYFLKKIKFRINIKYLLILMPLISLFFSIFQTKDFIGPATDTSFLPDWSILGYYFSFYLFGALFFNLKNNGQNWIERLSKIQLIFYLIPIGIFMIYIFLNEKDFLLQSHIFHILDLIFTWSSILILVLIFHKLLNFSNTKIKYLTDSSYYVYIIHVPVVIFLQGLVSSLEINHFIKFIVIISITTFICMVSYQYFVRNTLIGRLLNGKKSKEQISV